MNILWDLRLFSTGYAHRGVGNWTRACITSILEQGLDAHLFIWGKADDLPQEVHAHTYTLIPYKGGDWRSDLFTIPLICLTHNIDCIHYWVALGPILTIGLGLPLRSRQIITVYDCAIERWNTPLANARRNTRFWHLQKLLSGFCSHAVCISEATQSELTATVPALQNRSSVIYMPVQTSQSSDPGKALPENKFFITLGGAPHKNLHSTIESFAAFQYDNPEYVLIIAGTVDRDELPDSSPTWIRRCDMSEYHSLLQTAAGLLFFSLYEGLGIPVIEALSAGCPVAASNIPSLHEIAENNIAYADPLNIQSMTEAIRTLVENPALWRAKSESAYADYMHRATNRAKDILSIYTNN